MHMADSPVIESSEGRVWVRGAVTLAGVMSVPMLMGSEAIPERDLLIFLTFFGDARWAASEHIQHALHGDHHDHPDEEDAGHDTRPHEASAHQVAGGRGRVGHVRQHRLTRPRAAIVGDHALKVVLADRGSAPTLIFDEVDAGIGGANGPGDEDRWDDEPDEGDVEEEVLERGYAPWEVRVEAETLGDAHDLAEQLRRSLPDLGAPIRAAAPGGSETKHLIGARQLAAMKSAWEQKIGPLKKKVLDERLSKLPNRCRMICARFAPTAVRIANSLARAAPRAAKRFATFAQAMRRTKPTAPNNRPRLVRYFPTRFSKSGVTTA